MITRIISQSGRTDIPYEVAVVYVEYESVIAKVGDERYVMGEYLTEEKAIEVMEHLRRSYYLRDERYEFEKDYFWLPAEKEV